MDEKKIIINTQGGPVINGGTFTNVEFVANKYVVESQKESKQIVDATDAEEVSTDDATESIVIPDVLSTPESKALCNKLYEADIVDVQWQPIDLSNAEKGTLAEYIAEKLNIRNKWKLFGNLWKMDSETLRTAKARGLEQEKTWKFRDRLDAL